MNGLTDSGISSFKVTMRFVWILVLVRKRQITNARTIVIAMAFELAVSLGIVLVRIRGSVECRSRDGLLTYPFPWFET